MFDVSQGEARSKDDGCVGADSACSCPSLWWQGARGAKF